MSSATDYGRPVRKSLSLHGQKSTPNPKFLVTAEAYFICHIAPNFQISLIYAFIGCPESVVGNMSPCPICLRRSWKVRSSVCIGQWTNVKNRKLICDELGNKLECSFLLLLQLIIQPLCSNLRRKCWQTVMFACRDLKAVYRRRRAATAAATRRRIEVVWARREKLSYAGRASIVTWRKQRKWVEMKMQMRRMFAGHCRGGALAAATAPVQCIAVSFFDFISDFKQKTITELFTYEAA